MTKFWCFHWILTYHKPDLIFSSEIVMTIVVIFIKVRITLRFSKLEQTQMLCGLTVLPMLEIIFTCLPPPIFPPPSPLAHDHRLQVPGHSLFIKKSQSCYDNQKTVSIRQVSSTLKLQHTNPNSLLQSCRKNLILFLPGSLLNYLETYSYYITQCLISCRPNIPRPFK